MTEPTAAPAAAPAAPAPAAPPIAWLPEADTDTVGFIQNKAWATPADAVKSYRALETFVGADKAGRALVLPTEDTPEAWAPVYEKLGRPAAADQYKLPVPEGQSGDFAKVAGAWFHEAGLPLKAGQFLAGKWNEFATAQAQAAAVAEAAQLAADDATLAKAWGAEAPMRTELARRAAVQYGLKPEVMDAIEKHAGKAEVMQFFAKLGDSLREHGAEGLGELGSFGMTPEGAAAKKREKMADPDFRTKALASPDSAEWAEIKKLDKIIMGVT